MPIFVVHVRRTPEALARIVLLFHRRRVQIHSLVAHYDRRADVLRVEIQLEEVEGTADLIVANLYKLVDVVLVENGSVDCAAGFHSDEDRRQKR